jgi:hypothetical protein
VRGGENQALAQYTPRTLQLNVVNYSNYRNTRDRLRKYARITLRSSVAGLWGSACHWQPVTARRNSVQNLTQPDRALAAARADAGDSSGHGK